MLAIAITDRFESESECGDIICTERVDSLSV